MKDRIVLVTGSTDGIGKQTASDLAGMGATVLIHGKDTERCLQVKEDIQQQTGNKGSQRKRATSGELEE